MKIEQETEHMINQAGVGQRLLDHWNLILSEFCRWNLPSELHYLSELTELDVLIDHEIRCTKTGSEYHLFIATFKDKPVYSVPFKTCYFPDTQSYTYDTW